ncbi:MAG: DinB family protein [Planctomycetes bacterium]|nr:DinB family protein [Planctomycetota bacterium]
MNAWGPFEARLAARVDAEFDAFVRTLTSAGQAVARAPGPGSWSALEIGEHVALANHFLGLLATKIVEKSLARHARGVRPPVEPPKLDALARRDFRWPHPPHMTPTGSVPLSTVLERLEAQRARFAAELARVGGGIGALHRIRISVVPGDDRLDFYRLLEFVLLHVARHRAQAERALALTREPPGTSSERAP